jgi:hypothetical protein
MGSWGVALACSENHEVVDHEGNFKEVTRASDPELFYTILGGSSRNLGKITHFTMEVHRDSDYKGS